MNPDGVQRKPDGVHIKSLGVPAQSGQFAPLATWCTGDFSALCTTGRVMFRRFHTVCTTGRSDGNDIRSMRRSILGFSIKRS